MRTAPLILAFFLSGCATWSGARELSVTAARANYRELNGKIVSIRGWMGSCWNMDCTIYANPDLVDESYPRMNSLVIGMLGKNFRERAKFDAILNSYKGRQIILQAKFDATCITGICLDRASVLKPIRVVRVIGTAKNVRP